MPNFLKNAIDKSSLGLKSLPKIAPHTLPRWHPNNPTVSQRIYIRHRIIKPITKLFIVRILVGDQSPQSRRKPKVRPKPPSDFLRSSAEDFKNFCYLNKTSDCWNFRKNQFKSKTILFVKILLFNEKLRPKRSKLRLRSPTSDTIRMRRLIKSEL